ncbi:urea ABC transporter permease subunit UrtC [Humisphaera borealis]|uniref:Urea ABC transporter permease subunit UrtC n=1 Tax=Humisphaera borealis TaxID=2807512 RepID=A0A7M2X2K8_9BACT|nr:urea ABC transporter permease subunit UrtC [Humisphaera borealis]QOV91925.1 urea ABC transporter permease subunit UrtC [Humisphaera borealis]
MKSSDVTIGIALHPTTRKLRMIVMFVLLGLFFVAVPALNLGGVVPDYRVQLLGKYLCFALVALGVDLVWGYTGLLTLCQALFFCAGGYCMGMFLSLPQGGGDVRPEYNNIPHFMYFNNLRELPLFWKPFASMGFAIFGGIMIAALAASLFGFVILRNRVKGVYFSIITQAVAWGGWLLISRNEMLLGGTNGLTNFNKDFSQKQSWILGLYLLTVTMVLVAYLVCRFIVRSRLGRVLVAVRDKESRLYFSGYKPHAFKVFAFAVGAALAAVGGMLYAPQVGIITPQDMHVDASIFMVILIAVGGRGRLWGAILGALLVNYAKSSLTSYVPNAWLYVYGSLFIAVVLFFPDGFVGLWDRVEKRVEQGAGPVAVASAAIPIFAVCLFTLSEALGFTPEWMQKTRVLAMPLHYYLLIMFLVVTLAMERVVVSREKAVRARMMADEAPDGVAAGIG